MQLNWGPLPVHTKCDPWFWGSDEKVLVALCGGISPTTRGYKARIKSPPEHTTRNSRRHLISCICFCADHNELRDCTVHKPHSAARSADDAAKCSEQEAYRRALELGPVNHKPQGAPSQLQTRRKKSLVFQFVAPFRKPVPIALDSARQLITTYHDLSHAFQH